MLRQAKLRQEKLSQAKLRQALLRQAKHKSTVNFCKNRTKADPEICINHFENENERKIQ